MTGLYRAAVSVAMKGRADAGPPEALQARNLATSPSLTRGFAHSGNLPTANEAFPYGCIR